MDNTNNIPENLLQKPLQQSSNWNDFQRRLNKNTVFFENEHYSYLGIINKTPVGNYMYFPYGPYIKDENGKDVYKELISIAKKNKCFFIRIEPQNKYSLEFIKECKRVNDINPSHTLIIDISKPFEDVIMDFSSSTRRHYRSIEKTNLKIVQTNNVEDAKYMFDLQSKLFKKKGLNYYPESYFKEQLKEDFSTLYLCYLDEKVVGAVLYFDYLDTRYYMQAATDDDYKNLPVAVDLVTKAMIDAKEKGITKFDFWGIAPEGADESHPWFGFTTFKKRFGGEAISYLGTYDYIINRPLYSLYTFLRAINRLRIKLFRH